MSGPTLNKQPSTSHIRWMQISLGVMTIGFAIYGYVTRSATASLPTTRLATGLIGGVLIIYYFASKLVREWHQPQDQLAGTGSPSPMPRDANLLGAAFSKRPILTVLVLLVLFLVPFISRFFFALAHGSSFTTGDWHAILIGEALAALVILVIWRWPNWFG